MADDSNILLRWPIDNVALATGNVESGVFNEGGVKWSAAISRCFNAEWLADAARISLQCLAEDGSWACEADVEMCRNFTIGFRIVSEKNPICFNESNRWQYKFPHIPWSWFVRTLSLDVTIIIEFRIRIIRFGNLAKFAEPSSMSNVTLKFGDEKLHVSKEYLAVHSPVFEAMFFGEFAEKEKDEVELKDIDYKEFLDLLRVIHMEVVEIRDHMVPHIMKLADRFDMKGVQKLVTNHLKKSTGFDVMKKLLLADQYRLTGVLDHCLEKYTAVREITELKCTPEYADFSDATKAAICDRMTDLEN